MHYFSSGDREPEHRIDVLVRDFDRTASGLRYLARFRYGWRWVDSRTELQRRDKTPLTWHFVTMPKRGRRPVELRTLTADEQLQWFAS
ncbi:hypothetical protein [Amycolatopsis sp. FDAARGOS 1241]|uniref:hypothetical protein n=1 Tax=Amycolatopsis sp. FDAARGOS 1241 TaxID=2778070 RepID=UPI00195076CF|nr:hypothetical protein [Amycolatopsis sp. FDAARGOS 1241]QRP42799.1 hypothetical protein I6J71_25355 [Amycolatopsis sp. FDAARGOS 1241]